MVHLLALKKAICSLAFHLEHLFLDVVDERPVAVDDVIEHCMEQVIGSVHEELGRLLQLLAERRMGAFRAVADRNHMTVADEDGGLAIFNCLAVQSGGSSDYEQLVAEDFDLRKLIGIERVLDSQRVKAIAVLEGLLFF